jgi:NAD(P)-dependent dehydrogenase (short-subunit alcohol dehydrogenase family)
MAKALHERGTKVVLVDLADMPEQPLGQGSLALKADVTSAEDMQRVVSAAEEHFGALTIWVNNAGLARHRWITDYTEAEIDLMLAVNLKGTILGSQAALRAMQPHRRGHILNVISTASLRGIPSESVYCAAKWGVRGFTQGLQEEAAAHDIRVIALLPGGVATDFWADASRGQAPVEKFLTAEQVAAAMISALQLDDHCVAREIVLRSMQDRDFSVVD